jgi:uncharacterized protein (TIGR00661 family)
MRFLFVVQGEGRGHMTQAIALSQMLAAEGHELCAVCVGRSKSRVLPRFFLDRIAAPILTYDSPNFKTDPERKGISLLGTAIDTIRRIPQFARGLNLLHETVKQHDPDIIVNFFDPLAAIYSVVRKPRPKMVCVGHQYLLLHPGFVFPPVNPFARLALISFIRLCALGADRLLALSFRVMADVPQRNLYVLPPLLRKELSDIQPETGDFILVYVLNDGYADDLIFQQRSFPNVKIIGFWDRKGVSEETWLQENLVFRQLDDVAFLDAMARCRGLMSTAGFESVCEAMYLGKPVYMTPTRKQTEQLCNALDATISGAGIWGLDFDLERFLEYLPTHNGDTRTFRAWVDSAATSYSELFAELGEAGAHADGKPSPELQKAG